MGISIKYHIKKCNSPFWAFAIHDGHLIDDELLPYLLLSDQQRLREEDPFTSIMAELSVNQFIMGTSRFQLDINRPKEQAIYLSPEQAWQLEVWKNLPQKYISTLRSQYELIYDQIEQNIKNTIDTFGYFVILDIHSYNAKRENTDQKIDIGANPQINLGTQYIHQKWKLLIEKFIESFKQESINDLPIDIRENVKFKGGNLNQFINNKFFESGCVISIEFRKDFMDEWTGIPNPTQISIRKQLLLNAIQSMTAYFKL